MSKNFINQIEGEFIGYNDGVIFKLTNGEVWQQSRYKYKYHYAYRPRVRVFLSNSGSHLMEVEGVTESVEVARVSLIVEGQIVSDFEGYNQNAVFEFQNGQIWKQNENKHMYYYAHRPQALIIDGINGFQLQVDGMGEPVRVRKV